MLTRGNDRPTGLTDRYLDAVIHAPELSWTQRFAGVVCAKEADERGCVSDSVGDIADRWKVARRSLVDHLSALVKHGWLYRDPVPGKASHYELRIPNSDSNVSRETNSNDNSNSASNVIGIGRGILNAAQFISDEHGFNLDTAIALAEYVKATTRPRSLIAYVRRIPYSDLRAMVEDLRTIPAPRTGNVVSIPQRNDTTCEIHPDHIGGNTAQGIPRCPICRKNPERTGQR